MLVPLEITRPPNSSNNSTLFSNMSVVRFIRLIFAEVHFIVPDCRGGQINYTKNLKYFYIKLSTSLCGQIGMTMVWFAVWISFHIGASLINKLQSHSL